MDAMAAAMVDDRPREVAKGPSDRMVQMNTRIERELKRKGDEALRNAGFTPSQAVRALWEFAARHRHDPGGIRALLDADSERIDADADEDYEKRLAQARAEAEKGASILSNFLLERGIDPLEPFDVPYEELKEAALVERYEERGLL